MTSPSVEFQRSVLTALKADAAVGDLVGDRVYDHPPESAAFPYVSFGPSDYFLDDTDCIGLRIESLQIDVWARSDGRIWPAREIADAVKAALHLVDLSMNDHAIALLRVDGVRVFMDADGETAHGVVTLEAEIEEN